MSAAAGAAAAAAAAKRREELRHEEEQETAPMSAEEGFEYKILRSSCTTFRNPAKFRAVLDHEAQAGWDLFEKLDDQRLRLRRSVDCRERDTELSQDPYRTWVGPSDNAAAVFVVAGVAVIVAIVLGFAIAFH